MKTLVRCLTVLSLILLPVKILAAGPDVSFYGVIKAQYFLQDNPFVAVLNDHRQGDNGMDEGPLVFQTWVELTASNVVQNASLTIPGGAVTNLLLSQDGMTKRIEVAFDNKAELDAKYPNGTYTLTMQGNNDGTRVVNLSLTGDTYPSVPRVSNYDAAQAVNGNSFTLTWDAGGTGVGYVEVRVEEQVLNGSNQIYQSPDFGTTGALDGSSTSVLITNLSPGKVYTATLMFASAVVDSTSYGSGVTGVMGFTKETEFTLRTTGAISETIPPTLQSSTPRNGSMGVALNSVVAFRFSEAMQPGYSIVWDPSVNANNFTYTWSADAKTLFCKYNTALPANTNISWTLNASSSSKSFRDLANNQLGTDIMGSFNTGSQTPPTVDVEGIFLRKGRGAFTTNGTPVDSGMFVAKMESDLTGFNTVTNVTLNIPGVGNLSFGPDENDGDYVDGKAEYASQADLDRFFPNGTYTVSLNTVHDGTKSVSLTLTGNEYPSFPTIGSFSTTQSVNPSNSFALSWTGFTGTVAGTANDFIDVRIRSQYGQEVYNSPEPGTQGFLDGTATQVTIPANTLAPGRTYEARVRFVKVKHFEQSATGYTGVMAVAFYASETEFELKTTGQVIRPRFSVQPMNNGSFQARLTGEKGAPYTIEATQDFVTWNLVWSENAYANANGMEASIDFMDWNSWNMPRRFYRAKEGYPDNNQGTSSYVSIEGTVRSSSNNSFIQGAVVATSLDNQTATTDASGYFFLQTVTPANYSSTPYEIRITKSGFQTFRQTNVWGDQPRNQQFFLSP